MYRITYLWMAASGPRVVSITHPDRQAAETLHDALRLAGVHVRLWDRDGRLVRV